MKYKEIFFIIIFAPAIILSQWKNPIVMPKPIAFDTAIVKNAIYVSVLNKDSIYVLSGRTKKGFWATLTNAIAEIDSTPKGKGVLYYNRDNINDSAPSVGLKIMDAVAKNGFQNIWFTSTKPPKTK